MKTAPAALRTRRPPRRTKPPSPPPSTRRTARGEAGRRAPTDAGETAPRLGKVLDFMRLVWGLHHGLQTSSKQMEANLGVTSLQRLVVRVVGRLPDISAGELAEVLRVHPSTLTGVLRRLEERGAVERHAPPEDHRRALLRLTPRGRDIDELRAGTTESAVRRALSRHTPEELATASRVLATLARELEDDADTSRARR